MKVFFTRAILLFAAYVAGDLEEELVGEWQDTEITTNIWRTMSSRDAAGLEALVGENPDVVHMRSADGRGALFWAYEYGNNEAIQFLLDAGADAEAKDVNGMAPRDMIEVAPEAPEEVEDEDEEAEEEEDDYDEEE